MGRRGPNPKQLDTYIEGGGFWVHELPDNARYYKAQNADYQQFAVDMGFYDTPAPYVYQIYSEELQKFRLAAEGSVRASLQSIYVTECNSALRHYPNGTRRLRERWSKIPDYPIYALATTNGNVSLVGVAKPLVATDPWAKSIVCVV